MTLFTMGFPDEGFRRNKPQTSSLRPWLCCVAVADVPLCSVTYLVNGECSAGAAGRVAGRLAKMRGMGGWVGEVESFTLWQESLIY